MSIVTFVPQKEDLIVTCSYELPGNESIPSAPVIQKPPSGTVIHPQTDNATGTWIAAHENGNFVAFLQVVSATGSPHKYRKPRGMVLLDLIDHTTPLNCFLAVNLNNIEPFTAIVRDNRHLFECIWDGAEKTYTEAHTHRRYLWMSPRLSADDTMQARTNTFLEATDPAHHVSADDIIALHESFALDADHHEGQPRTHSITAFTINSHQVSMSHIDIDGANRYLKRIPCISPAGK